MDREKYPKQNKPLYCFKLNANGTVTKYEHWRYVYHVHSGTYRLLHKNRCVYKSAQNLNKFLNGYIYTFNPSENNAKDIIRHALKQKIRKAAKEMETISHLLGKMDHQPDRFRYELKMILNSSAGVQTKNDTV